MQVHIIVKSQSMLLENAINQYLNKHEDIDIISIQYTSNESNYSAMIIYKESYHP